MDFTTAPRLLTARGWGLALSAVVALLAAQVMGRRDVLVLAVFLLALPLLAALSLRLVRPALDVERTFSPATAEAGAPVIVTLSLHSSRPFRQSADMREGLPLRFGQSPVFRFPARVPGPDGGSMYEYQLLSTRRGLFPIGPVSAEFQDMFGLARVLRTVGGSDPLVVAPAPLALPRLALGGPRGKDGALTGPQRGSPSEDDVSTREYRPGDPMRRVHWAATARHGELMVRQEEPVTSPRATLLLDTREGSHADGAGSSLWLDGPGDNGLATSESFERAVSAAVSVAAYLVESGYALHLLDAHARPALERSASAPDRQQRDFDGVEGLKDLAEGLAALELDPKSAAAGSGVPDGSGAFGDELLSSLVQRHRGPLIAVLGRLSMAEARQLAPAADHASRAYAILTVDRPQDAAPALAILRAGGWEAVAAAPKTDLARSWAALGDSFTDSPAPDPMNPPDSPYAVPGRTPFREPRQ
ncbi:DUF58 domain-containing protein [Arthrobacter sp. zg-ZUI100]|uniref:DUF58 domain-containing protein n=1 Tax=Arthrobacter jiangjiafuii TaxID=2817475 RepID=UPI001AED2192|nr:DUF58 domain-containing protein [Arthrobacter jiangjiafuii]MBP3037199.1 DUF58 domain-containing protein [Arthrobacter jiangjiafuii]